MSKTDHERAIFWEKTAKEAQIEADYYREQLARAHELIGRIVHQFSDRWDSVRLTKHYPTDNLHGRRTTGNSAGNK